MASTKTTSSISLSKYGAGSLIATTIGGIIGGPLGGMGVGLATTSGAIYAAYQKQNGEKGLVAIDKKTTKGFLLGIGIIFTILAILLSGHIHMLMQYTVQKYRFYMPFFLTACILVPPFWILNKATSKIRRGNDMKYLVLGACCLMIISFLGIWFLVFTEFLPRAATHVH